MIKIEKRGEDVFEVTVTGKATTTHTVTVDPAYAEELTAGRAAAEELVRSSFEFLLERESNTSILRSFELPVIGRYFPEYEDVIRRKLGG